MLGSVQISGEDVGDIDAKDICESLRNNSIRLLSLRGCKLQDHNYMKIMESLKENQSLVHLNLNLGLVFSKERVLKLADALKGNNNIDTLMLHGNPIGDDGMNMLAPVLERHPQLQTVDLGDCQLGDEGITQVCALLKHRSNVKDITELTLTGNASVTQVGWASLAMAIANGSRLKNLFLDYNNIGDFGAGLLAIVLSASNHLRCLDLEATGITDVGADILCDAIESHNNTLLEMSLQENQISEDVLREIKECLHENANAQIT